MKDITYYQDLLARSLDEALPAGQAVELRQALAESAALHRERAQLLRLRGALQAVPRPSDAAFTEQVLKRISNRSALLVPLQWGATAAAACAAIIITAAMSIYLSAGSLSQEALLGVSELAPEDAVTLLQDY